MLYELRVYEAHPGKAEAMRARFRDHAMRLFPGHGITLVGVFALEPADGRIAYIARFADEAARQAAWASFGQDAEWKRIKAESERDGPLLRTQTVTAMTALPTGLLLG
jgi:hypothetical protein